MDIAFEVGGFVISIGVTLAGVAAALVAGMVKNENEWRGGYSEKDAAKDTDSSGKATARAWHKAREDAQEAGELPERKANKEKKREND